MCIHKVRKAVEKQKINFPHHILDNDLYATFLEHLEHIEKRLCSQENRICSSDSPYQLTHSFLPKQKQPSFCVSLKKFINEYAFVSDSFILDIYHKKELGLDEWACVEDGKIYVHPKKCIERILRNKMMRKRYEGGNLLREKGKELMKVVTEI